MAPAKAKKAVKKKAAAKKSTPRPVKKVQAVPPQYGSATAYLTVSPCAEALEFYKKAFGAKLLTSMPGPGGSVMHAEMKIGDSIIMFGDEMPPMQGPQLRKTPKNAGTTTGGVMLYVKKVDEVFNQAVAAGAQPSMPPADMFWGDRYGQLVDPFGHVWAVATHIKDVTPKQMMEAMAKMGPPPPPPAAPSA